MRTPVPWSDAHLPNGWHLSADRVPIPPVPATGRARRYELNRRRLLLPDDMYYDHMYASDSPLWDTWLQDEHDVRRASYFAGTVSGPRRPRAEPPGRTRVRGLTSTPSPSPSSSPPPPPRMTVEEEACPPSTTHRRPTSGRRRSTSTSSATTMTLAAASEDGHGHGTDGRGRSAREEFFIIFLLC